MLKIRVSIFYFPGTNCERESLALFNFFPRVIPKLVFMEDIILGKEKITEIF